MRSYVAIIAVLLLLYGCSKRPKDILSEDMMVSVMTDIQLAEAYDRTGGSSSFLNGQNREALGRGVLKEHGVTQEQMDSTLAWYGRNMDEYSKLYQKIDKELSKRQALYAKAAGENDNSDNSTDLWPYTRHLIIDNKGLTDGLTVDFPVNDLTPGEKLTWRMSITGATSRSLTLGVEYDNGTSELIRMSNRGLDKRIEAELQTDTTRIPVRIFASAAFDHDSKRILIDSILLLRAPYNREDHHRSGFQRKVGLAGRKIILPPDTSANSSLVPDSIISKPS